MKSITTLDGRRIGAPVAKVGITVTKVTWQVWLPAQERICGVVGTVCGLSTQGVAELLAVNLPPLERLSTNTTSTRAQTQTFATAARSATDAAAAKTAPAAAANAAAAAAAAAAATAAAAAAAAAKTAADAAKKSPLAQQSGRGTAPTHAQQLVTQKNAHFGLSEAKRNSRSAQAQSPNTTSSPAPSTTAQSPAPSKTSRGQSKSKSSSPRDGWCAASCIVADLKAKGWRRDNTAEFLEKEVQQRVHGEEAPCTWTIDYFLRFVHLYGISLVLTWKGVNLLIAPAGLEVCADGDTAVPANAVQLKVNPRGTHVERNMDPMADLDVRNSR